MRTLSLEALQRRARVRPRLKALRARFVEVLAVDPFYPSVWTHHTKASAKLGVVINVIGRGTKIVSITDGSRHDVHLLKAGPWVKGRLLIFDLGSATPRSSMRFGSMATTFCISDSKVSTDAGQAAEMRPAVRSKFSKSFGRPFRARTWSQWIKNASAHLSVSPNSDSSRAGLLPWKRRFD